MTTTARANAYKGTGQFLRSPVVQHFALCRALDRPSLHGRSPFGTQGLIVSLIRSSARLDQNELANVSEPVQALKQMCRFSTKQMVTMDHLELHHVPNRCTNSGLIISLLESCKQDSHTHQDLIPWGGRTISAQVGHQTASFVCDMPGLAPELLSTIARRLKQRRRGEYKAGRQDSGSGCF